MTEDERKLLLLLARTLISQVQHNDRDYPAGFEWDIRALVDEIEKESPSSWIK